MIAARDPQEFIPGGRQQALQHPGPIEALNVPDATLSENFLLHRFEKVSLTDLKVPESWIIRRSPKSSGKLSGDDEGLHSNYSNQPRNVHISKGSTKGSEPDRSRNALLNKSLLGSKHDSNNITCNIDIDYMEEELYIKGNVVIWSQGLVYGDETNNSRKTICAFSSNYPVKHALWCNFYCEKPLLGDTDILLKAEQTRSDKIECVCVIDAQNFRAFTKTKDDFVTTLPFQVRRVWNTKFGLLLEKEFHNKSKTTTSKFYPTMFSMAHPLDEVHPVAIWNNSLQLMEDESLQIVYTNDSPSICMVYDSSNGHHYVYRIRKITYEEWLQNCQKLPFYHSGISISNKIKSCNSFLDIPKSIGVTHFPSPLNSCTNSVTSSKSLRDFTSFSPFTPNSRCHTPIASPLVLNIVKQHRSSKISSSIRLESSNNIPFENIYANEDINALYEPALCLDYLWSDNGFLGQDGLASAEASKVFLSKDLTGQSYLCYLIPLRSQLCMVRVDFSNIDLPSFSMITRISAKDAVPIEHLCMIAILEHNGNIQLYSGLATVGKLHLGNVLAQHIPSPYVLKQQYRQYASPFPKRSSLLSCCNTPTVDPKFDELLSPVLPIVHSSWTKNIAEAIAQPKLNSADSSKSHLCGLRDAIYNRLTLQYTDGTYYRVTLPTLASSPLVDRCLNALRQSLHRDATLTLLSRWYSTRNAPGPNDLTNEEEWNLFSKLLFELFGYYEDSTNDATSEHATTPSASAKRQRQSNLESEADWKFLMDSDIHESCSNHLNQILGLRSRSIPIASADPNKECHVNTSAVLFTFIKVIHYILHLLYEDLKLNTLYKKDVPFLANFLSRLAFELNLTEYQLYYYKEFPRSCVFASETRRSLRLNSAKMPADPQCFEQTPPNVAKYLLQLLEGKDIKPFPIMRNVNQLTRNIIQICGLYIRNHSNPDNVNTSPLLYNIIPVTLKCEYEDPSKDRLRLSGTIHEQIVTLMTEIGIKSSDLDSFPIGINLLLHNALWLCREQPPMNWDSDTYNLLLRLDLANQADCSEKAKESSVNKYDQTQIQDIAIKHAECGTIDGMEGVGSSMLWTLRFPEDLRVVEARRLLQSSKPVPIVLVQRPDVSDHDFIEEQERHLYAICTRTMALPIGRGMFTMRTANPVITEPLPIPPLCLTGKAPPKGTTVEMTRIDVPANMNFWPLFHNGVANGLRISPEAHNIDSTWITFNRPKNNESSAEYAGFLLALGLNGHLKNLAVYNTYDYLMKRHEMTSLGLLLGLSATFRGTSSVSVTKMLSVHVEALLPPTSMELDIQQNIQVGALLGIGLVYQGTGHRHMTEVLLTEIGRPPGPEMENSVDRESYSLAAGLALGLVCLQKGGKKSDIADLNVPDTLHYYMVGGNKRPLTGSQKEKYKVSSFQIREGSSVNLDVTAPGATLALGLMYLGSGNRAIADWMSPPHTPYLLDFVRPDFLMLRTLSRSLILWDEIEPNKEWIEGQVLPTIRPFCMVQPIPSMDIDYEAMNQAYCNIIAGACFAVGLKYAGSANHEAFAALLHFCHMFTSLTSKSIAELAGKPTIETCLNFVLLSTAMVMAGTGNLEIMRIVRHLRRRVGVNSSAIVTYGSHLAIHMALGLLFLGGGRFTLSNSPESVAALICAFYPKFPTHSNDNRYHLQTFRHLYVLAVEPRLLIPKDVALDQMCYANIKVVKLDGSVLEMKAPGLLPDLNHVLEVRVHDQRYWPVIFRKEKNFDKLTTLLHTSGCISVQQRAGCVSYIEDKFGYKSDLANSITQAKAMPWDPQSEDIISFTSDCTIRYFCEQYLRSLPNCSINEEKLRQMLTGITYDCVVKDKLFLLPIIANLFKIIQDMDHEPDVVQLQQFKLISAQILNNGISSMLINSEIMIALQQTIVSKFDKWEAELKQHLQSYIKGGPLVYSPDVALKLCMFVNYYDIPYDFQVDFDNSFNHFLGLIYKLPNKTLNKMQQIMS